jgi:hypothetical protein
VELRIAPLPSLLEPLRVLLEPDEKGIADAGTLRLHARPYVLIEVPPRDRSWTRVRDAGWRTGSARLFFLSTSHADSLLGVAHRAFEPFACVSYDGTWLHLPPADDWSTEPRGDVFAAFPTSSGLFTTTVDCTLAPDTAPRVALPPPQGTGRFGPDAAKLAGDSDCYRQIECATLFDPRPVRDAGGDPPRPVDPFASLSPWRTFVWTARDLSDFAWQAAPGRWVVTNGEGVDRTFELRPSAAEQPPK